MSPKWGQRNLRSHHRKHPAGKDRGCWLDLLGKEDEQVSETEYEAKSVSVCSRRWLEYLAEELDVEGVASAVRQNLEVPFHPRRRYHVDEKLIITITDIDGQDIVTCFHEHFGSKHVPSGSAPPVPVGELKNRYRKKLEVNESSNMIRNLDREHDEP